MNSERWVKIGFWILGILLLLDLVSNVLPSRPVFAVGEGAGRYQISSWAAYSGGSSVRSGYYILDTTTGQVLASKAEQQPAQ